MCLQVGILNQVVQTNANLAVGLQQATEVNKQLATTNNQHMQINQRVLERIDTYRERDQQLSNYITGRAIDACFGVGASAVALGGPTLVSGAADSSAAIVPCAGGTNSASASVPANPFSSMPSHGSASHAPSHGSASHAPSHGSASHAAPQAPTSAAPLQAAVLQACAPSLTAAPAPASQLGQPVSGHTFGPPQLFAAAPAPAPGMPPPGATTQAMMPTSAPPGMPPPGAQYQGFYAAQGP